MDTKRLAAEIVADFSIGPKLGLNPMNQQIEALLEQETTLLGKKEGELSQLQKMIMKSENETEILELQELLLDIQGTIELSKIKIEKLEGALEGKPLYSQGYINFRKNTSQLFKRWKLREKFGLS